MPISSSNKMTSASKPIMGRQSTSMLLHIRSRFLQSWQWSHFTVQGVLALTCLARTEPLCFGRGLRLPQR